MLQKKLSNTSNSTPSEPPKKTASARKVFVVAGLLVCAVIFAAIGLMAWRGQVVQVHIGNAIIEATIADDEAERQKGLGGAISLADDHGMLFVFPQDALWAIWMKDMAMPLDIVWLDADKKVVHVVSRAQPGSYPAHFMPPGKARYVLELAAGVVEKTGIAPGVIAQFDALPGAK